MSEMIAHIRGQVVQEKAEAEVAIAQRDRLIGQLRSRLDAVGSAVATVAVE